MKKILHLSLGVFPVVILLTRCEQPRQSAASSSDEGAKLFVANCARCHLANGTGGPAPGGGLNAVDIRKFTKSPAELAAIIKNGFGQMPAFGDSITPDNISRIANYVATQIEFHSTPSIITAHSTGDNAK